MSTNWEPWGTRMRLAWHRGRNVWKRLWMKQPSRQTHAGAVASRTRKVLATLARPMDRYTLVSRRRLDPDDQSHATWSLVFDGHGRPEVLPGDMAYLSWQNSPEAVREVLDLWKVPGDRRVAIATYSSVFTPGRRESMTLAEALARRVDLHEASPRLLPQLGLAGFLAHNAEQDLRHRQFHRESGSEGVLVTHPHFDYRKVHLPRFLPQLKASGLTLAELVRTQPRIRSRPFTLAAFRQLGDRFEFEITVSQVDKPIFVGESETTRVSARSSGFLHSLEPGDTVEGWLLPEVHRYPSAFGRDVPLVMVSTGSGISSLLSLLRSSVPVNDVWAVYGVRSYRSKHLYGPELQSYLGSGRLTRLDVATSRPQEGEGPARRVQNVLWDHRFELADWIRRGAHFYLCGRLSMGSEVARVLEKILLDQGLVGDEDEARKVLIDWKKTLRFQASVSGV